jgi:hypothetical protein
MSKQTNLSLTEIDAPLVAHATTPEDILALAVQNGRPVSELTVIAALIERRERSEAAARYNAAIARFQSKCPTVFKSRTAKAGERFQGYQYASYDDVMRTIKPFLDECQLGVGFSFEQCEGAIKATCKITHGSHSVDHTLTVPIPSDMRVNDTQKYGAAITYVMRYCLCAALNVVVSDEDDDAQGQIRTIDDVQARALEQMLVDTNSDIPAFCDMLGVKSIATIPERKLDEAKRAIARKIAQTRKAAQS